MDLTRPLLAAVLLAATFAAGAGPVYKWVDGNGKVRYSDTPQVGWKRVDPGIVAAPPAAEAAPADDDSSDDADEADSAGETQAASDEPTAALKAVECKRRREQLAGYEKASRIVQDDGKGGEKEFTETERLRLIQRTQNQVKELCG